MLASLGAFLVGAYATTAPAQYITTVAGGIGDGGPATAATLNYPSAVALDAAGNRYIADSLNHRIRKISADGKISTVAGTGEAGFGGDGASAINAKLNEPKGVMLDVAGNIYVADSLNHRIRKVAPDGKITTIAGTGTQGYGGDNGPALNARLSHPRGIAVDASGNVYFTEFFNHRIRKISPSGTITSIAGTSSPGFGGDGALAVNAALNGPTDIKVDGNGNVYFADAGNYRIRRIAATGTISTVAGNGYVSYVGEGNGGQATSASISYAEGIALDSAGSLYIMDSSSRLRKVSPNGIIQQIFGANLVNPYGGFAGGAVDAAGNLYFLDIGRGKLWKLTSANSATVEAGGGAGMVDGSGATQSALSYPSGVRVDKSGNIFISEAGRNRVLKVGVDGKISTLAGSGTRGFSGDGGQAVSATLDGPLDVAVGDSGNVYVADANNNRVRQVAPNGVISTFAGTGTTGVFFNGVPATMATLNRPAGLDVDAAGNVFIAANEYVVRASPAGQIAIVAGDGSGGYYGDGGPATAAKLRSAGSVAVDKAGNVYIADYDNVRIRKVSPAGIITTVAGTGQPGFSGDGGPATSAKLASPFGVAVDAAGNLYIADTGNNRIRKVSPDGIISTLAGDGNSGSGGDGGLASLAQLNQPYGVAVDAAGDVYVADTYNGRVRKISTAVAQPRTVVEYYNADLRHYFVSGDAGEQQMVDTGGAGPGWVRTGDSFKAFASVGAPPGTNQVCRFYGSVSPGPNSHFYTASQAECDYLKQLQASTPAGQPKWHYEGLAFASYLPTGGQCPAQAPVPVYRAYNDRAAQIDSNHRLTTRVAEYQLLISLGWKGEGVTMCGAQ